MFFSKQFMLLGLLSFLFCAHAKLGNIIVGHKCFGPIDFPDEEVYEENLEVLLTQLTKLIPQAGFSNVILGGKGKNQTVSGLTQCWGSILSVGHLTS